MIAIGCEGIKIEFGAETVIDGISFRINEGDKLGIVGVNGAGKSTLLKVLTGEYTPDAGSVYIARGKAFGMLDQNMKYEGGDTVLEEALKVFESLRQDERELEKLHAQLENVSGDTLSDEHKRLAEKYASMQDRFTSGGGYEYKGRCTGMLRHTGFGDEMFGIEVSKLSGGQKTRLALACLLLKDPDILLLDEPTNHLDTETLFWLEEYLRASRKTVITVSHDRYFLDKVVTHILEIENTHGKLYGGNYSEYVRKKAEDREIQQRHYDNQQKEIARIEAYIEQQRRWNRERNIIAAESRQKQLDKLERIERPEDAPDSIRLKLEISGESGNDVVTVRKIGKRYGSRTLFENVSFDVRKRERVFISGPNGCGKSTMMKMLSGRLDPDSGSIEYGYRVEIGYYDQENQELDESKTVLDELWDRYEDMNQSKLRGVLALFNFRGDDIEKKVSVLSGGEKARLTMAKLILSGHNLLILDEPTNHLDIPSREALESALADYAGTVIAVSHDRYFVNKLAGRMLDFRGSGIFDYRGDYTSYLEYCRLHPEIAGKGDYGEKSGGIGTDQSEAKDTYLELKRQRAEQQKQKRELENAKKNIAKLEKRLEDIEKEIAETDVSDYVKLSQLCDEKQTDEDELLRLYEITMNAEE